MAKEKDIKIANHHTGPIVLPKMYNPNVTGDPAAMKLMLDVKTIQPGQVLTISATEYEIRKGSPALMYYLDNGHLQVVKSDKEVDINTGATTDLEIPVHLQVDQNNAVTVSSAADPNVQIKADIRKTSKSTVTVQ